MEEMLKQAKAVAILAHGDDIKYGVKYIKHPLHVMGKVSGWKAQAVAVLHDVIEDTNWTMEQIRLSGVDDVEVLEAVGALTRDITETYEEYIERVMENPLAVKVKLEDLKHNMDVSRLPYLSSSIMIRLKRYHKTYLKLNKWIYNNASTKN